MEGLRIVSDGTVEGTAILLDGHPLTGNAHVSWAFSGNSATLVMELADLRPLTGHDAEEVTGELHDLWASKRRA